MSQVFGNTSGGGAGANSFSIIQPITGTAPTAASSTDTLTFLSGDSTVTIAGDSTTKTLDIRVPGLAAKAPLASPTFTGTIGTALTASRALVTDVSGNLAISTVTSATLAFLDVGSSLTTLLAAKAPSASPTFTGTITTPLTAHGAVISNSSNQLATVAPGSSGNVLTSNGTDWTSAAAAGLPTATTKGTIAAYNGSAWVIYAPPSSTYDDWALKYDSSQATGLNVFNDRTRFGRSTATGATFIMDNATLSELSLSGNGNNQFEMVNQNNVVSFKFGGVANAYMSNTGQIGNNTNPSNSAVFVWGSNNNQIRNRQTLTTTNGTATDIFTVPYSSWAEDMSVHVVVTQGRRTDVTGGTGFFQCKQIYHWIETGAVLTLVQTDNISTYNPAAIPVPSATVVGRTVHYQVTGVAAQTWSWNQTVFSFSNNGDLA